MAEIGQLSYSIILDDKKFTKQAQGIVKKLKDVDTQINELMSADSARLSKPFDLAGMSIEKMVTQAKVLEVAFKGLSQSGTGALSQDAINLKLRWQEIQAEVAKYGLNLKSSLMEQQKIVEPLKNLQQVLAMPTNSLDEVAAKIGEIRRVRISLIDTDSQYAANIGSLNQAEATLIAQQKSALAIGKETITIEQQLTDELQKKPLAINEIISSAKTLELLYKSLDDRESELGIEAQKRWLAMQDQLRTYGHTIKSSVMEQQTLNGALAMQENTVGQIELKMKALSAVRKNINITEKESIDTLKEVNDEYVRLGDQLKKVGARQYNLADLARNTNGAFSPLSFSIQQVARELPSLTMGAQMFFLAISNNLPILSDELRKAKASYAALVAEGKTAVPVWKQVLSSIFSWQTAMVVGITLLTMYGREVGNWIKGLFGANEAYTKLNKSISEQTALVYKEQYQINQLFDRLQKAKKGTDDYRAAKELIISKYGDYLKGLDKETIALNKVGEAYKAISFAALQAAKDRGISAAQTKVFEDYATVWSENVPDIVETLQKYGKSEKAIDSFLNNLYNGISMRNDPIFKEMESLLYFNSESAYKKILSSRRDFFKGMKQIEDSFNWGESTPKNILEVDKIKSEIEEVEKWTDKTNADRIKKNQKLDELNKKLQKYKTVGVPTKKELNQLNSMARAEEQLGKTRRKVENENLKFDLEMRGKAIGIMEEGYAKKYAQLILNNQKELQALKEHGDDLIDEQQKIERAQWQKAGSKGVFVTKTNSVSDLPKETQDQMKRMFKAISAESDRGYQLLNREEQDWLDEANMMFADSLQKRLFEINKNYRDEFLAAKGNHARQVVLRRNMEREITQTILDEDIKRIEFQADLDEKRLNNKREVLTFESSREEKALKKRIEAQKKILKKLDRQLFKGDNSQELKDRIAQARAELEGLNSDLEDVKTKKAKELYNIFSQTANILGEMAGLDLSALDSFADFGFALADPDSSWMSKASSGLSVLSGVLSDILSKRDLEAEIQRELVKLQQQYNIDLRQQNYDLISSVDYARAFRDNMEALRWLVEKGLVPNINYSAWDALNEQYQKAEKNGDAARAAADELGRSATLALESLYKDFVQGTASQSTGSLGKRVSDILKDWKNGAIGIEETFRRLEAAGWKGMGDISDQISKADEESKKWAETLNEVSQQMDEFATGTNFDGFLNDAMTAMDNMRKGVSNLSDFTEESLTNAILSSFKYQVLAEALKPLYDQLADKFIKDFDNLDKTWGDQWQKDLENKLKEAGIKFEDVFGKLGIDNSSERAGLSGSLARASQDSIDELTGVMYAGLEKLSLSSNGINAINITTTAMSAELKTQTALLRSINGYSSRLPYIETGIDTLVRGVKIKP